jgi:uncharacterized protein
MRRPFNKTLTALALVLTCVAGRSSFAAGTLYYRGDGEPIVVKQGSARALGRLGFRYESGLGVLQNYIAAANLYLRAAERGDTFAQSRLGLSYDKGHGVPKDFILAYKWLDIAAARGTRPNHDFYLRLRDAVASKMSFEQVSEGQRLALIWSEHWAERLRY